MEYKYFNKADAHKLSASSPSMPVKHREVPNENQRDIWIRALGLNEADPS